MIRKRPDPETPTREYVRALHARYPDLVRRAKVVGLRSPKRGAEFDRVLTSETPASLRRIHHRSAAREREARLAREWGATYRWRMMTPALRRFIAIAQLGFAGMGLVALSLRRGAR